MKQQLICLECLFFNHPDGTSPNGYCHRFPELIKKNRTDWCGEFVHKDYELNWLRLQNNKLLKA